MSILTEKSVQSINRVCGWAAAALVLFTMLTGYGITEFHLVTSFSFGILGKATSQKLHHYLDIPIVIFLAIHVGTALWIRLGARNQGVDRC